VHIIPRHRLVYGDEDDKNNIPLLTNCNNNGAQSFFKESIISASLETSSVSGMDVFALLCIHCQFLVLFSISTNARRRKFTATKQNNNVRLKE